jgi:hypothetical protein
MKNLLSLLIVLSVSYGIAYADGFTNESVQGTYAMETVTGANNGCTIGLYTADGNGNFTGSAIMNVPGLFLPKRMRLEITSTGTYDVNSDGTLVGTSTFTTSDGSEVTVHFDAIIKKAEVVDGIKLATEFVGFFEEPGTFILEGKPGLMTTVNGTRLPD